MANYIETDTIITSSGIVKDVLNIGSTGGTAAWGEITGTLSNQIDLNLALIGKADTSHNHDLSYSSLLHNHDSSYSSISHNHSDIYSDISHNHDLAYSQLSHTHGQLHDRLHSATSVSDHSFPGGTTTFLRADGTFATPTGGGADPWTIVKLASNFSTTASTNTNVTGFYFTPEANKTYYVLGVFMLRTATATVGARPGIAWPSGLSDATARAEASSSLTTSAIRIWGAISTQNASSAGLADTTNSHYGGIEALIVTGASPSGNFQITLASESSGTSVTMRAQSFFMYREV